MQMCVCASVDYLASVAFCRVTFPSSCHDCVCPFKLPVKHPAFLPPAARLRVFEQVQRARGIQMETSEGDLCKTKFCVCSSDEGDGRLGVICQQQR